MVSDALLAVPRMSSVARYAMSVRGPGSLLYQAPDYHSIQDMVFAYTLHFDLGENSQLHTARAAHII